MNSKLSGRKTEKHEIQMLSCDGELKADEYWMNAERPRGFVILQEVRDIRRATSVQSFEGQTVLQCWWQLNRLVLSATAINHGVIHSHLDSSQSKH